MIAKDANDEQVREYFRRMPDDKKQQKKELYEHLILLHSGKVGSLPYPITHKLYGKSRPAPDTMPWMLPAYMNGLKLLNEVLTNNTNTMETTLVKTELGLTPEQEIIANSKQGPWGTLGVKIAIEDFRLQSRAQNALATLITPTKIEDVAKAEAILKTVKAAGVAIKNDRLAITKPVDNRMSELMLPEKSFEEPCKKVEAAIIALKKADQARQLLENQKLDALKNCREWLTTTRNNTDAAFKNKILAKVGVVYEHALGKGEVDLEMLKDYLEFAISRLSPLDYEALFPLNTFQLVPAEQFQAMCQELLIFDFNIYKADYTNQLNLKFSDYAVALGNKAQAVANSKKEAEEKQAAIESQKANSNVAAKLETIAITPVVLGTNKALKQSYAIDMEENIQSVIAIMTAFTAHLDLCLPELNVNKWFSFTPAQAGTALAKIKTKDNSFNPAGIIFKTVDKL